jgi:23S rRNA pseudouridine2605 synthase
LRLNRFISASGFASRRRGEVYILEGRVKVNGETVTDPARDIDTNADRITLDENVLTVNPEKRYYVLNKPTGVIATMSDTHGRATVLDLLGEETRGVFPVGRLDADTSGVLLFTDDGDLAHRLIHPSFGVEKTYRAEVRGRVNGEDSRRIGEGILLDDGPAAPATLCLLDSSDETSMVEITLHQGRKRQVRRMLETLGHPVITLERTAFGGITAKGLPPGSYRPLTAEEIGRLEIESKDKALRHSGT